MSEEQKKLLNFGISKDTFLANYVSYGYFCDAPLKDEATLAYEKIVKKYNKAIKNLADK